MSAGTRSARAAFLARPLAPWLALLPVVLLASVVPLGRAVLAVALVATATLTAAAARRAAAAWIPSPGRRMMLAIGLVGSVALAVAPTLLAVSAQAAAVADPVYDAGARLLFVLHGWGAALTAVGAARGAPISGEPPAPGARAVAALLGAAFAGFALAHALFVGRYAGPGDDVLYLLQSRLLGEPGFARRLDPALAPFFVVRQAAAAGGRLFTQYPPGWPAVLALLDAVGARWWSGVLLGTLAVWLTYALGRRLRSAFVGFVAAALLAASFWLVQASAMYDAHSLTTALVVGAALLLLRAEAARGAARAWAWVGAGLLLGGALVARPLTGACLGLSLVGWMALRRRLGAGELAGMVAALAAGAAGPALALLAYDAALYGSPWTIGYRAVNGALHDLGFGLRGYVSYDARGCPVVAAAPFTPRVAAGHLAARAWDVAALALPAFLLVPLSILVARPTAGATRRPAVVAAFLVLPAVHVFYFFSETRFYTELFPFLFVGVAVLLEELWRRDAGAGRAALTLGLTGAVTWSALWLALGAATFRGRMATFDAVERARRERGRVALFVADTSTATRGAFYALYWFNVDRFPGDVVVARDLGAANGTLLARLPGHVPVRLAWDAAGRPAVAALRPAPADAPLPTCGAPARYAH